VAHFTEDTINDKLAEYLRANGIKIFTQFKGVGKGSNKPDFQIMEPKIIFGEGEWETSKVTGFRQMTDYLNLPGSEGAFLLIYPKILKSRDITLDIKEFFKDVTLHGIFSVKGYPTNSFFNTIEELPEWINYSLEGKRRPDKRAQIETIGALVDGLTEKLPKTAGKTQLFQHVAKFLPNPIEALKMTNRAAAYLLVDQIVFYRILSSKLVLDPMRSSEIHFPSDLYDLYFKEVIKHIDYEAVFGINLSDSIPKKSLQYVKDLIDFVDRMRPEAFSSDFLGSMFHNVIPLVVRKPLACYYTNQAAAALLTSLTVEKPNDSVADFACGSGTILMAAYDRKAKLLNKKITQKEHEKFLGKQLTGIDVMAFAAHLAAVQLSLKQPTYMSNFVRIGVEDSLPLYPKFVIEPLSKTVSEDQSQTMHVSGAVSRRGTGTKFELTKVDVILMNPPFTRKQKISKEYRADLRKWLSPYKDYISDSYSLWAYFILIADKFIKNGGRVGFVLPVAILKQDTYSKLRQFIAKNFQINYVIVGGYKCAFSENTAFRECLLILEKKRKSERTKKARFVFLNEEPTLTNIDNLTNELNTEKSKIAENNLVNQKELAEQENWWDFIPEHKLSDSFSYKEEKVSSLVEALGDKDYLKQGLRFHGASSYISPKNSIISHPKENVSIEYEIIKEDKNTITFTDQLGNPYKIDKKSLCPSLRTMSHQKTISLNKIKDWLVIDRFENDENFWGTKNVVPILIKRRQHMNTRLGNIAWAGKGNYDISAPGTCLMAIACRNDFAPVWNCWRLIIKDKDDAKIMTLFLNSTFALANQLDISIEVRGAIRQWRYNTLAKMKVLDPKKLNPSEKKTLVKLFDEIATEELPSLLEQLQFGNQIRNKIDEAIAKIIIKSGMDNQKKIRDIQIKIAERILFWKQMMEA